MSAAVTIRIARLVVEAGSQGEADTMVAAFRGELARHASEGRLPAAQAGTRAFRPLGAVTPAGRGREASGLLAPKRGGDAS